MKKIATPSTSIAPDFSWEKSKPVTPYRHEDSARTVGRHQPAEAGQVHLFSATGLYIDTVAAAVAAKREPKPAKASIQPAAPDASAPAAPASIA